jgi:hypothetical protein
VVKLGIIGAIEVVEAGEQILQSKHASN